MDAYDEAVEFALVKGIDPQEHIAARLSPEQEECTHHWPSGVPSTSINLATLYLECAQCGQPLVDLNPWVSSALQEPRQKEGVC